MKKLDFGGDKTSTPTGQKGCFLYSMLWKRTGLLGPSANQDQVDEAPSFSYTHNRSSAWERLSFL